MENIKTASRVDFMMQRKKKIPEEEKNILQIIWRIWYKQFLLLEWIIFNTGAWKPPLLTQLPKNQIIR